MKILYFAKISDQLGKKEDKLTISNKIKINIKMSLYRTVINI